MTPPLTYGHPTRDNRPGDDYGVAAGFDEAQRHRHVASGAVVGDMGVSAQWTIVMSGHRAPTKRVDARRQRNKSDGRPATTGDLLPMRAPARRLYRATANSSNDPDAT